MVRGGPGTGKTVLGVQFLTAGADDAALFVHFEETTENIVADAERLGFDVDDVAFLDLSPDASVFAEDRTYGVFGADEVEAPDVVEAITDAVESVEPDRVFVDPLTQLQHLTPEDYQFKRTVSSFMRYLTDAGATVLFSTQPTQLTPDDQLEFLSAGTLELARTPHGRTLRVNKLRGSDFRSGVHTMRITDAGMAVFPKLVPEDHGRAFDPEQLSSNVPGVDALLGGGIERGTVALLSGPSGVGKTTLGTQFALAAAERGERAVVYLFEETAETLRHRSASIGSPVGELEADGRLVLEEVEPLTVSPDEFAARVREEVEGDGASFVMVDGISGYRVAIRGEGDELTRELHALGRYLRNMGATSVFTDDVSEVTGPFRPTQHGVSYLGDTIVFLRYVEMGGELRKVVGVLKKRAGGFERSLREFQITGDGLVVGDPLDGLRGVLQGVPEPDR
jgi:circadian clock protein KaiC